MKSRKPKVSKAEKLSHDSAKLIHELGKLLDSPDPAIASDAKEYLMGLSKCLNFELNGREIAVVRAYER